MMDFIQNHGREVLEALAAVVAASSVLLKLLSVSDKVLRRVGKVVAVLRWLSLHVPSKKLPEPAPKPAPLPE